MPFHARRRVSFEKRLIVSLRLNLDIEFVKLSVYLDMLLQMQLSTDYSIFPLGDAALTIDFGNTIDEIINHKVLALFHLLKENPPKGVIECVPAYSTLTVYYDVWIVRKYNPQYTTAFEAVADQLEQQLAQPIEDLQLQSQHHRIPVCYDPAFALDMDAMVTAKNISVEDIVRIHSSKTYTVYMLGFLPGFTYMGKVDDAITMPRKINPRPGVEAGSVGIAGNQTGIYPLVSPGGWQLIGRTPLKLFKPDSNDFTLLKPGDTVQFYSISKDEFDSY